MSASAASSSRVPSGCGYSATMMLGGKRAARAAPQPSATTACQISSEMKGMIGWSRRSSRSRTWSSTPRVRSAAAPPAPSGILAASTYQSQNSFQVNW